MEYAELASNRLGKVATGAGAPYDALSRVTPPSPDQPRIVALLDGLEKHLHGCMEGHQRIQNATSRLLGAEPERAEKDPRDVSPVASSVEQRLREVLHGMEILGSRLYETSQRLDSAI